MRRDFARTRGVRFARTRAVCFAAVLLLSGRLAAAAGITAEDFRHSHFRGFNVARVNDGPPLAADLDALGQTGANLGRIFFEASRCSVCLSYSLGEKNLLTLDRLLRDLRSRSVDAVVVLTLGGDERGLFWRSGSLQDSFVDIWRSLAARYRSVDGIAGFDLLNEPVPPGRTYDDRQNTWLAYAERLGSEIRKADPDRVLIVESAPDATPTSFGNLRPIGLPNVVYSVHSYFPMEVTHQGVMKPYDGVVTYGAAASDGHGRTELFGFLEKVAGFAGRYDVPILVGEFSCVRWAPGESAPRYVADSLDFFESHGWSWAYHEYRRWHGWDAEMQSGARPASERSAAAPIMRVLRARLESSTGAGR